MCYYQYSRFAQLAEIEQQIHDMKRRVGVKVAGGFITKH
jgi:hypothetical protein